MISHVSSEHSFDFLDAQFKSSAGPGVAEFFAPPYLAWHDHYQPSHVGNVHEYLREVIEEDGPYDGVIGFSQGAALAASLLLYHESQKEAGAGDSSRNLFKVAIFFNSVVLLSPCTDTGNNIDEEIKQGEAIYAGLLRGQQTISFPEAYASPDGNEEENPDSIFGFESDTFPHRIQVPTLHVIGIQDQYAVHSRKLVKLCRPDRAQKIEVDCGHEVPRNVAVLTELAEVFELVVSMASMQD